MGQLSPAIALALLALYIFYIIRRSFLPDKSTVRVSSFLDDEHKNLDCIMNLVAHVLKADGQVSDVELKAVELRLHHDYTEKYVQKLMAHLRVELANPPSYFEYAEVIANHFDTAAKIQLMHLLISISTADGIITDNEFKVLRDICRRIEFSPKTFDALLAMFRFRTEQQQQQKQKRVNISQQQLMNAYAILEIEASSTEQEIKKAYKTLAKIHHPDKVAHLGEDMQKVAAEKFKIILAAYELICKKRGIA